MLPSLRKNWKPFVLALGLLGVHTLLLLDSSRNRFSALTDDVGNRTDAGGTPPALGKLEWTWYDLKYRAIDRFRLRGDARAKNVLVAKIDDASLERFGRWPWSRQVYSEILSYLYELGAEVVAFDAVFSEHEFQERFLKNYLEFKDAGYPTSLRDDMKLKDEQLEKFTKTLPGIGNLIFGRAVNNFPKTVLGYFWQSGASCNQLYDPADPEAQKHYGKVFTREEASRSGLLHVESLVDNLSALSNQGIAVEGVPALPATKMGSVFMASCPTVNRGEISAKSKYQGFFSAASDVDGIFRRLPLLMVLDSEFVPKNNRDFLPEGWFKNLTAFPSLAIEAVSAYWESPKRSIDGGLGPDGRPFIRAIVLDRKDGAAPVRIPTHPDGSVPLNFYGSQTRRGSDGRVDPPIGEFSLARIHEELNDANFQTKYGLDKIRPLAGQIVIIGPTALGVYDLRPNPVQGDAGGVYLHATMAARVLESAQDPGAHLAVRFGDFGTNLAFLWGFGILLALWLLVARSLGGILGTIAILVVYLGVDMWAFVKNAYALDSMTTALGLVSVFLGIFAWKYFTEEKERAFVKGAFEKYVSPDLVGQIMDDPKKLNLGGKKAELSVLFSDVRGFTTISEKMDAAGLARFMNEYLSPMTDLVQANKGTIDKYMGDAIMAIFGAPIEYPEHAEKATDAALDMLAKLPELVKEWSARGLPPIDIGIGINTGEMSVGNMGSSRIFSYTVMGDSVNLGSRLEGINKEYGTNLIVSEFTRAKLPPAYLCRELDRVKVKGKKLPVTIFEVMGKGELPGKQAIKARFEEGLQLYYAQKFREAREVFDSQADADKTSKIYLERCDYWMEHPPESDWDGSWTMKTK